MDGDGFHYFFLYIVSEEFPGLKTSFGMTIAQTRCHTADVFSSLFKF